ncbi:hypothetical protein [Methylobacterium sp. R2-1]|uniref:hypothetical protein n=1 Tax=Methylobacterium sp. R2-1 TaxID=2587064 RepID=UPI00161685FB|nr:hypothetical protein [Methylobacterium sp. R2-1]MBB2961936.1 ppGpp synthetase/RelA/SpoT-type nucleotidyltransferase [Methylobacterium sp. R2-1]
MNRLEGNDLILRCREVDDTAKQAVDADLLGLMQRVAKDMRAYAFKARFKEPKPIEKKVLRKRAEGARTRSLYHSECARLRAAGADAAAVAADEQVSKLLRQADQSESYEPDHVTDGWGCRFVSLYQSEIPPIVEALLQGLEKLNKSTTSTIRMKECVIYTNRPSGDPLSIVGETMRIARRSDLARSVIAEGSIVRDPENRKSAYSSVHFVFERDVLMEHAGKDEVEEVAYFEVQVRDIFEEGWGEVQHHLLYSQKDDLSHEEGGEDTERQTWQLHLNALKTFVDGCSQHASIIKRNLEMLDKRRIASIESESLAKRNEDRKAIIKLLKDNGRRRELQKSVSLAYTLLANAESAPESEEAAWNYSKALGEFQSLKQSIGDLLEAHIGDGDLILRHLLETEAAHCAAQLAETQFRHKSNLTDEDRAQQKTLSENARDLYEQIVGTYKDDAAARLGLAKALIRVDGASALTRAEQLICDCLNLMHDDDIERHRLLPISARLQKGVVLWQKSKIVGLDPREARQLIERAVDVTQEAFRVWSGHSEDKKRTDYVRLSGHKAASNVLYYLAQLAKRGWTSEGYDEVVLRKYIDILESFSVAPYNEYYKTRDNLMQARSALGQKEVAEELARETFNELRAEAERRVGFPLDIEGVSTHLRGAEGECYRSAVDVLLTR